MTQVTVLDYDTGNLRSIVKALQRCEAEVLLTGDPIDVARAGHLVIPGVGAFGACMNRLHSRRLVAPVLEAVGRGARVLGICVGMQLLLEEGEEFGRHEGLGVIPGKVVAVPDQDSNGSPRKIPHIGWSPLQPTGLQWRGTILDGIEAGACCYFVHSYHAVPRDEENRLADTCYGDTRICATVRHDNVYGCQFHPEKSGATGLATLARFLEL